jgi:arsenate reductase-like glutaredoxin family protein
MLGSTGNLRSPTVVSGNQLLVGFNEDVYREVLTGS